MRVERISLEDLRNYRDARVEFAPGMNLVVGRNAQGKTNLLEAVYCLTGFGSPRSPDSALIREGTERALVHAEVVTKERAVEIDLELRAGRGMRALVNKSALSRSRSLSEFVVAVFFGPDELSLVKGSPEGRRRFVDELVVKRRPARAGLRREWERTLKQRNALLREWPVRGPVPETLKGSLEVWDESYARAGARLASARLEALARLVPHAEERYQEVAGAGSIALAYGSSWAPEGVLEDLPAEESLREALLARMAELRPREIERGASLVGPQRDDVSVRISPGSVAEGTYLDVRTHASQGDQRTTALALKLAEQDLLTTELGEPPILLLDDVFSELDPQRRSWLRKAVAEAGQTLVSTAELEDPGSVDADRVLSVEAGRVEIVA